MRWAWTDTVRDAVAARLRQALPLQIDSVDIERGVSADTAVQDIADADYWTCDKWEPPNLPACEIVAVSSARVGDTLQYRHSLTVVFTIGGTDEQLIDQQMTRILLAALLVLDEYPLSSQGITNAGSLHVGDITYDLVQPSDLHGRPFIRTGMLDLTCDTFLVP